MAQDILSWQPGIVTVVSLLVAAAASAVAALCWHDAGDGCLVATCVSSRRSCLERLLRESKIGH